jgi:chromosomal replication initiation ATPase DnaA
MCKWRTAPASAMPEISRAGQQALLVQMAVAEVMGIRLTELCSQTRGDAKVAFARQTAMYLCHAVYAMRVTDIAAVFGRDRSTAAHAIARIEEAREDPETDRRLQWLEAALSRAGGYYG